MTDEESINAVEDKTALLRPNQIREATCGWKGLLVWAVCTMVILVFGVILVKLFVPTPGRASQFSGVSLFD